MTFRRIHFALLALVAACSSASMATEWRRVPGVISIYDDRETAQALTIPDTVTVGASFTARVTTFGSGSCTRADGATVQIAGSVAEIAPFDLDAVGGGGVCTDDLRAFPRDVQLRLMVPGEALVRVRGTNIFGAPATIERRIIVR
ncbi:MAG TPA: hypothetical protein VF584_07285 [Longimicrobium sp.]